MDLFVLLVFIVLEKDKTIEQNISPCSSQKKKNVKENGESLKIF